MQGNEQGKVLEMFKRGDATPQEVHRKLAFGGKGCDVCSAPAAIRVRMFLPLADVLAKSPEWAMKEAAKNEGKLPLVDFKHGKHVRVSQAYACERCRATLEREAAKAPSYCVVEIDEGPEPTAPVSVPSAGMPGPVLVTP